MIVQGRKYGAHSYRIFGEAFLLRNALPSWTDVSWIVYGNNYPLKVKYTEFQYAGKDAYIQVSMTHRRPIVFIADPQAIKELAWQRTRFTKWVEPIERAIGQFGPHLVSAEGEAWKRQRRINQKAFTERNIQLVWSETTTIMKELFSMWEEKQGGEVRIQQITDVTEMLALMAISSAAFGRRLSWDKKAEVIPKGYKMSFRRALSIVSSSPVLRAIVPGWADGLTEKWRTMSMAYAELMKHLQEMKAARRSEGKKDPAATGEIDVSLSSTDNLFDIMITASDTETTDKALSEEEVTGNAFIFLVAGHETTAHALAFSLGLLALNPEVQEEVYAHIKSVIGTREVIDYVDLSDLKLVTGVFLEALRMYPVVMQVQKLAQEDTVLSVARNGPGKDEHTREEFLVPAESLVYISVLGTHYNPTYWPEPERFSPARFTETYNKDAFLAFSAGHRSCIGRKFAETEATVALAMLLIKYKIAIDDKRFPPLTGESTQARQARLLEPSHLATLAPRDLPLMFKRR
ncbi:hypothetical protein FRC07_000436 [Ceratobasidium sp. 392]|nr:hypothetical protein FRC07_000436 [Ceratobasidium sp. 392]